MRRESSGTDGAKRKLRADLRVRAAVGAGRATEIGPYLTLRFRRDLLSHKELGAGASLVNARIGGRAAVRVGQTQRCSGSALTDTRAHLVDDLDVCSVSWLPANSKHWAFASSARS